MSPKKIESQEEVGDVHLCEPWRHDQYNDWKFNIKETDQEDSEVIKELDWEETHRKWDEDYYCWTVDLSSFMVVLDHFTERGYDVTFSDDVFEAFGKNSETRISQGDI